MSAFGPSGHAVLHLHMSASDPKRTSPASIDAAFEKKDRLTAVLLKSKVTAYQCALMRIEAGWPGSLKRFRGNEFCATDFQDREILIQIIAYKKVFALRDESRN